MRCEEGSAPPWPLSWRRSQPTGRWVSSCTACTYHRSRDAGSAAAVERAQVATRDRHRSPCCLGAQRRLLRSCSARGSPRHVARLVVAAVVHAGEAVGRPRARVAAHQRDGRPVAGGGRHGLPNSGCSAFPGGLALLQVDREADTGLYCEPNVWGGPRRPAGRRARPSVNLRSGGPRSALGGMRGARTGPIQEETKATLRRLIGRAAVVGISDAVAAATRIPDRMVVSRRSGESGTPGQGWPARWSGGMSIASLLTSP